MKAWKESFDQRDGFSEGEKALMCMSSETVEGLHISGKKWKLFASYS